MLPALLPLLDGTRTVDDLTAHLGSPAGPAIERALELLGANGLLVEGPEQDRGDSPAARVLAAAYGLAPDEAERRLRAASVGVVGAAAAGEEVARLLHAAGAGDVRRLPWSGGEVDLAIVAPSADEVAKLDAWNLAALDSGVRWLGLRPFDGHMATVGPLVVPGESCCHECLLRRLAGHVEYGDDLAAIEATPPAAGRSPALELIAAGVAAHVALCWLGGLDPSLPGVLYAIETRPALALDSHAVLRVPRCPACSPVQRQASRVPWHEAVGAP
ncbi:MAG TPA: TOMM precursor leader peptide-binding protein [Gaiellaceae bacterium]